MFGGGILTKYFLFGNSLLNNLSMRSTHFIQLSNLRQIGQKKKLLFQIMNLPLKSDSRFSEKGCVIRSIERPLNMMKNAFYFILKALFFLSRYLNFVMTFWSCRKNSLIRKIRLTSMTSQPG